MQALAELVSAFTNGVDTNRLPGSPLAQSFAETMQALGSTSIREALLAHLRVLSSDSSKVSPTSVARILKLLQAWAVLSRLGLNAILRALRCLEGLQP